MSSICSRNASASVTPYPWGFSELEIDRISLSRASSRCAAPPASCRTERRSTSRRIARSRSDRCAGDAVGSDRLADDADGGTEHAGSRRSSDRQRQPLCSRFRDLHRFDLLASHRGRNRHRLSAAWRLNCARPASQATWPSASRAFSRSATSNILFDDKFVAADAVLRRASGRRGLAQ